MSAYRQWHEETMDYVADLSQKIVGETFTCYRMEKILK